MSGQVRSISKKGTSLFTTCQVEKIGIFNNLFLQKNAHLNVPFFEKGKVSLKRHAELWCVSTIREASRKKLANLLSWTLRWRSE